MCQTGHDTSAPGRLVVEISEGQDNSERQQLLWQSPNALPSLHIFRSRSLATHHVSLIFDITSTVNGRDEG